MKKMIFILLVQISVVNIFGNDIIKFFDIAELTNFQYNYFSGEGIYTGGSEKSVYIWKLNKGIIIPREKILINNDGFSYYRYEKEVQTILYGSNYFYAVTPGIWSTVSVTERRPAKEYYNNYTEYLKSHNSQERDSLIEYDIKRIDGSSVHSENLKNGKISYSPNFINCFEYRTVMGVEILQHNPWVPGKANNPSGIGEYLEIDFTKPTDNLVVLNGFVDFNKRYLYKANNRVKKAIITSLDKDNPFEVEYDFEDYVHFSEIAFPKAVNKVRFTIKEVYKGEKWDDTCITAVITRWEQ